MPEQRKSSRRQISYYLSLHDADTDGRAGVLMDVSPEGFKVECDQPVKTGQVRRFRLYINTGLANQTSMVFSGLCIWCQTDPVDTALFHAGFKITNANPGDARTLQRLYNEYGTQAREEFDTIQISMEMTAVVYQY